MHINSSKQEEIELAEAEDIYLNTNKPARRGAWKASEVSNFCSGRIRETYIQ